jgi:opacity protein-like surface antigen
MRKLFTTIALFAAATLSLPAIAADKLGMPPSKIDAQGVEKPMFNGCYVSAAGSTVFAEVTGASDAVRSFMAGMGCDIQRGKIVFGASAEYGFGESDARFVALTGRVGFTLNPHLLLYIPLTLTMDGRDPKFADSALSAGLGLETYVARNVTLFIEGTAGLDSFGDAKDLSLSMIKIGGRYKF